MRARQASMLASTDPAELVVWPASKPRSRRSRIQAQGAGAHQARLGVAGEELVDARHHGVGPERHGIAGAPPGGGRSGLPRPGRR